MKRVIVLVQDSKPNEILPTESFDVSEAAMAALDRCRALGYTAAECAVVADDGEVLGHKLVNSDASVLRIEAAGNERFLREDPG